MSMTNVDEIAPFSIKALPGKEFFSVGVLGDGSCFFHSILVSLGGPSYLNLSQEERYEQVSEHRKNISETITEEDFENMGEGAIAEVRFIDCYDNSINRYFSKNFNFENITPETNIDLVNKFNDDPEKDALVRKFIKSCQHLSDKAFKRCVKMKLVEAEKDIFFKKYASKYFDNFLKYSEGDDVVLIPDDEKLDHDVKEIIIHCKKTGFKNFVASIENPSVNVEIYFIEKISDYYNVNIIAIDFDGVVFKRDPGTCEKMLGNNRPFILVKVIKNPAHFESLFELRDKKKKRWFTADDEVIKTLCPLQ